MTSIRIRLVAVAASAILASSTFALAQEASPGVLNVLEVQQLVARAEPEDHARLSVHFGALEQQYMAEAKRHLAMSRSFSGNPNRNTGRGMSIHCRRLAELRTESAQTLRELAGYHAKLAQGVAVTAPPAGAPFEAGAGAPAPTEAELNALAAKASTPAEHRALEEYFRTLATRYGADADQHTRFAQTYRGTRIAQAATQHEHLAKLSREAADEAAAAAQVHQGLAAVGR